MLVMEKWQHDSHAGAMVSNKLGMESARLQEGVSRRNKETEIVTDLLDCMENCCRKWLTVGRCDKD
jgi:hypothetical protein